MRDHMMGWAGLRTMFNDGPSHKTPAAQRFTADEQERRRLADRAITKTNTGGRDDLADWAGYAAHDEYEKLLRTTTQQPRKFGKSPYEAVAEDLLRLAALEKDCGAIMSISGPTGDAYSFVAAGVHRSEMIAALQKQELITRAAFGQGSFAMSTVTEPIAEPRIESEYEHTSIGWAKVPFVKPTFCDVGSAVFDCAQRAPVTGMQQVQGLLRFFCGELPAGHTLTLIDLCDKDYAAFIRSVNRIDEGHGGLAVGDLPRAPTKQDVVDAMSRSLKRFAGSSSWKLAATPILRKHISDPGATTNVHNLPESSYAAVIKELDALTPGA